MKFNKTVIAGIGETEKSRARENRGEAYHSMEEYYKQAAELTLEDAGVEMNNVDGFGMINPTAETPFIYPSVMAETIGLEDLNWIQSVDHGGASATSLLIQAASAVENGVVDTMLCLGADAPMDPYKDLDTLFPADPRGFTRNYLDPFGNQGPNTRLALVQRAHMEQYGTTIDQFGEIAVTQREHAVRNPLAYFDESYDLDEYKESPMISSPIRMLDTVMPVNGGFGYLLTSAEKAAELDVDSVLISGFGEHHSPDLSAKPDATTTGIVRAGQLACERAGIDPADADFFQPYDDYPSVVLMQIEDMGFCEKGAGGEFVEENDLMYDGDLPVNTSGGQLSVGQAGMAGGFVQLLEGIRQLRGEGGERQVPDAEYGIVTGVGGISYKKNLQNNTVVVLERGE
ncbi:thiolase family protein [Halorubrum trueperi]|uniref:Thiolase family protein n=1 Tax=Halorubrum trueperi TaxID=2004704 RepID=A0ABD5ULA0_9EURY